MEDGHQSPIATYSVHYFGVNDVVLLFVDRVSIRWKRQMQSGESTVPLSPLLPNYHKVVYINPTVIYGWIWIFALASIAVVGAVALPPETNDLAAVCAGVPCALMLVLLRYQPVRLTNWQFMNSQYQAVLTISARSRDLAAAEPFVAALASQIQAVHDAKSNTQADGASSSK